ncbi:uncharacterized protein LOC143518420 [Brachyhypopomus gauderio]|uniref:uncharacterized protein LOC143518420 n=1 Tax=Brachyhypopomus gauderio TaxID=698409 RepID=UPI0040425071
MDNRRRLPPDGGGKSNLSVSAVRAEHVCERVRRDAGDPVTSTRGAKEDVSGVPRKVPRFQYVDFPSLHQCIKQLTVPPLKGWLASCPLAKAPTCQPSGPKEKAPKFKYVDYPSLYHCIQQLSVPPLEMWSSGLTRPRPGQESPSRVLGGWTHSREARGATEAVVAEPLRDAPPGSGSEKGCRSGPDRTSRKRSAPRSECGSGGQSGSGTGTEGVAAGNETAQRPSVISVAHITRRTCRTTPEEQAELQEPSDRSRRQQEEEEEEERVCISDLEETHRQWQSHKDQTPH